LTEETRMNSLSRFLIVAATACFFMTPAVWAQTWPTKPVRMIVNANPGGSTDTIARSLAVAMSESLGQQVIVDNRPGAGGGIGIGLTAKSAPDGYTLLHAADSGIVVGPHLYKLPVDVERDLVPIAPTGQAGLFLIARTGLPVKNLADLVAYARANPGKLNYGSAGYGTVQHIAIEMMMRAANFKATHVAYMGSQRVLLDLMAGEVDFTLDLGAAIPQIKGGQVRLLAVPGRTRSQLFPDTPTVIETGTDLDIAWVSGVYAPAGTPRDVVVRLNQEIGRIMHTSDTRKRLAAMAAEPMPPMTPEAFAAYQQKRRDSFGVVIREANIRIQ
jgi:tripartite-type tricarboxylate transporter receptor subunit TctC